MSRRTRATERETSPTEVTRTTVMEVTAEIQSQNPKRETETRAAIARRAETTDPAMVTVVRTATTRATAPIPNSTVWTATTPDPSNDRSGGDQPTSPNRSSADTGADTGDGSSDDDSSERDSESDGSSDDGDEDETAQPIVPGQQRAKIGEARAPDLETPTAERTERARPRAPRERGRARHRARTTEALASGPNPRPARGQSTPPRRCDRPRPAASRGSTSGTSGSPSAPARRR